MVLYEYLTIDCSVIGSRLIFVLDDLLWVLTDAQLVAALHFVQSLSGLVNRATELVQKQKAKQKLEVGVVVSNHLSVRLIV